MVGVKPQPQESDTDILTSTSPIPIWCTRHENGYVAGMREKVKKIRGLPSIMYTPGRLGGGGGGSMLISISYYMQKRGERELG